MARGADDWCVSRNACTSVRGTWYIRMYACRIFVPEIHPCHSPSTEQSRYESILLTEGARELGHRVDVFLQEGRATL